MQLRLKKLSLFFLVLLCLSFWPQLNFAQQEDAEDQSLVKVEPPTRYYLKQIALFPLDLPGYVLRGAVFPIEYGFRKMEEHRVFNRLADFMSNEDKTIWVYPIIEGGAGSSFGGGVGTKFTNLFNDGYQFSATYRIHINLDQYASLMLGKENAFSLWNRPFSFAVEANFKRQLGEDFYGIGNNSQRSNQTEFADNDIETLFKLGWEVLSNFHVEPRIGFCFGHTGPKKHGGHPSIQTVFPLADLPGFNRWVDYLKTGLRIAHDTRDNKNRPRIGGERAVTYNYYQFLGDGKYSFNSYEFEVSQYIPLWRPGVVLALYNTWVFEQQIKGSRIPFYRLAALDAWHMLRGFDRGRFLDSSSVIFNVEYYFPISGVIEGMFFYDTGRVFDGITNFSFADFKYSAGAGLNFHLFNLDLVRLRVAYGGEGINVIIGVTKSL
ncbi:MAG: BamA/TamA family outer membrane protein [Pseudomonadota bacterium]